MPAPEPAPEPVPPMDSRRFAAMRKALGASQRELAAMLGVSEKAVESYEQGWRRIPGNIERILYFLALRLAERGTPAMPPCWELTACPDGRRTDCLAWKSGEGRYCWFLTGKLCAEKKSATSAAAGGATAAPSTLQNGGPTRFDTPPTSFDTLAACRSCPAFTRLLETAQEGTNDLTEVRDAP